MLARKWTKSCSCLLPFIHETFFTKRSLVLRRRFSIRCAILVSIVGIVPIVWNTIEHPSTQTSFYWRCHLTLQYEEVVVLFEWNFWPCEWCTDLIFLSPPNISIPFLVHFKFFIIIFYYLLCYENNNIPFKCFNWRN